MITGISAISDTIPTTASVTSYEYDLLGNVSTVTDPLGYSQHYTNYWNGSPYRYTDKNNNSIVYTYGIFGVKSAVYNANELSDEYTYNSIGQITKKTQTSNGVVDEVAYEYDGFGRVVKETNNGNSNTYTYDLNSNITSHTTQNSSGTVYSDSHTYDALNRLTGSDTNGIISAYTYDNNGNLTQKTVNNITTDISYNNANMPVSMTNKKSSRIYNNYLYEYNLDGNRTRETDSVTGGVKSYMYNKAGQLANETISVSGTNIIKSYTYDLSGNRTKVQSSGTEEYVNTYKYDKNNRLTEIQTRSQTLENKDEFFYYDYNGNQTAKQTFALETPNKYISLQMSDNMLESRAELYTYDVKNRLTGYAKDGTKASYAYNADGKRISKTVNGTTTGFVWDGGNMIISGNSKYSYGVNGIEAVSDGTVNVYVKDIHGTVTGKANSSGSITAAHKYDSFGRVYEENDAYTDPFGYCGEYLDSETGYVYLRARMYDPDTGRFITEDPIKDGLNWYVYCGNNPIAFVDPSGLEQIVISGGEYKKDGKYKYNFIEPAIKKLKDMKESSSGELVTWLIANEGWKKSDLKDFESVAQDLGVRLAYFSNAENLIKYINGKYDNEDRSLDKITKFVVFAHGWQGTIALGYNYSTYNDKLDFRDSMIDNISADAFNNPNSAFYACNTGTDKYGEWGNNFAQKWVNKVGGKTWAWNTYTFYDIFKEGTFLQKRYVDLNWFIKEGATNYPVGIDGVNAIEFTGVK